MVMNGEVDVAVVATPHAMLAVPEAVRIWPSVRTVYAPPRVSPEVLAGLYIHKQEHGYRRYCVMKVAVLTRSLQSQQAGKHRVPSSTLFRVLSHVHMDGLCMHP